LQQRNAALRSFRLLLETTRKAATGGGLIYNERRQGAKAEFLAQVFEGQNGNSASVHTRRHPMGRKDSGILNSAFVLEN